jgi:signal peptidase II
MAALLGGILKKILQPYLLLFSLAGIIVLLDQFTKYLVQNYIPMGSSWSPWPWLAPYARIIHISNSGAAFGIFQGFGGVFTVLAIIVSVAILYYFPRVPKRDWPLRLALILQFGGAIGNLIDRLRQGYVTDFVSVGNFAVFNVADSCISIGVVVLIIGVWIMEQQEKKQESPHPLPESQNGPGQPPKTEDSDMDGRLPVKPVPEERQGE